jgi:hypothetical protein
VIANWLLELDVFWWRGDLRIESHLSAIELREKLQWLSVEGEGVKSDLIEG